jgi:hypothetical protein
MTNSTHNSVRLDSRHEITIVRLADHAGSLLDIYSVFLFRDGQQRDVYYTGSLEACQWEMPNAERLARRALAIL